jgi:hypothetical protein
VLTKEQYESIAGDLAEIRSQLASIVTSFDAATTRQQVEELAVPTTKILDMLIDDSQDKYIELLKEPGHTANIDITSSG